MAVLDFISSLLGHFLSWPVLVLAIVFLFRAPVTDLLGRVRSYEGMGQKVTFGEKLAKTEDSVDAAVEAMEAVPHPSLPAADSTFAIEPSALEREAETNPSYGVLSAWENLVSRLRDLLGTVQAGEQAARQALPRNAGRLVSELQRQEVLSFGARQAIDELRELRNRVAHGQYNPTHGEALAYVRAVEELIDVIMFTIKLESDKRELG